MSYISEIIGQPTVDSYEEIAKKLLFESCIRKKDTFTKKDILYRFAEIEFYYWNRDNHQQDKSTYPRKCNVGDWFFHYSGVDIAFQTKFDEVNPDELTEFGGILIRGLVKYEDDSPHPVCVIGGPLVCCMELFNNMESIPTIEALPEDKRDERQMNRRCRVNIKDEEELKTDGFGFFLKEVHWENGERRIVKKQDGERFRFYVSSSRKKYNNHPS